MTPLLAEQRPDRAILCVAVRQASVPAYRTLIEQTGGRFLHRDGGEADSVAWLDQSLAEKDQVICQPGCISHDAYWRVKAHCKRTGKRCPFVEMPSQASLRRALVHFLLAPALVPPGSEPDPAAQPRAASARGSRRWYGKQHGAEKLLAGRSFAG